MRSEREITVRPMQSRDGRAYLETVRSAIVGVASAYYRPEVIEAWAPRITDENVALLIENPEREVRVIGELDGLVVGVGALSLERNELRACYVSPTCLRRGMGTAIVGELEAIAAVNDIRRLDLHAVTTAEPFFRRLRYRRIEKVQRPTPGGVPMDVVRMSKELQAP